MKVSISLPDELGERVDGARGDVSRSLWVRRAVERTLESTGADDVTSPRFVPAPTSAQQPEISDAEQEVLREKFKRPIGSLSEEARLSRAEMFKRAAQK